MKRKKKQPSDVIEKKDETPSRAMIICAVGLLFGAWIAFLYPWVRFQFWQPDTFWLIETGHLILAKHTLPTHDPFSFTASSPVWLVYQWLTEVLFSLADSVAGLTGVAVFGAALLAILFCVLIFRSLLKEGTNPIVGVAVIWLAAYSFFPYLSALRPQLISFVLFWLLAEVCANRKNGSPIRQALIWTFIIAVVWANCHVSFPIALMMLGANLVGSLLLYLRKLTDKRLPISFAAMLATFVLGTLVTPFGYWLWYFLFALRNYNGIPVPENQPLAWLDQPQLIALTIVTFASCLYLRKKLDIGNLLLLVALLLVGNNCSRLIVYFCIFSCPVIGTALSQLLSSLLKQGVLPSLSETLKSVALSRLYISGVLLLAAGVVTSQPLFLRRNVPVLAAKFIADHPVAGHLFCDARIGSYLIYSAHGTIPVFLDTRLDLYDPDFVYRFSKALNDGERWKELFSQYKIAAALVPNDTKLKEILDGQSDWKPVYRDPDFSLYIRNKSP